MVYSMAWRVCHGIWYGLARYGIAYGVAWQDDMYMVGPGRHGMVMVWSVGYVMTYDVVWRAWHGNWYGLSGMT